MRVAVYNRTSTSETGVTMQLKELRACSQRREWQIVEEFTDAGVAGGGHHNVGFPRRRKPRPVSRGSQTPPLEAHIRSYIRWCCIDLLSPQRLSGMWITSGCPVIHPESEARPG
jgi:hypothetical protein